jgi:DNA-binding NarL/FixJ family response regulator
MLSPSVTRTLIQRFGTDPDAPRRAAAEESVRALTDREREVAAEVARGSSNAEVAARLFMSEATVKAHVSWVMAKLGAGNRVQVAITARDAGLA